MKIHLKGFWETREVWLNDKKLTPTASQKIINHSPDGFNWGYGGSGPSQLALAVCLELYGLDATKVYQNFKWNHIASLPQTDFDVYIDVPDKVYKD